MSGLTQQQANLLGFIEARASDMGVPPSFDEMKDHLGLKSKSGIDRLLNGLEERGFIRRPFYRRARSIEVIKHHHCPNCGFNLSKHGARKGERHVESKPQIPGARS